jgi:hypothetical protein
MDRVDIKTTFLAISYLMFEIFKNALQNHEIPDLYFPIDTEVILFAAFLIPLTLFFSGLKKEFSTTMEIETLDKEIKKVEKEFDFHGSLTFNLITQPFWLVLIVEVIPRVFDLLRKLFNT